MVNLAQVRTALKPVAMRSDMKHLDINASNFDVNDPQKRPIGWQQVRLRRVLRQEGEERSKGKKETEIKALRHVRSVEVSTCTYVHPSRLCHDMMYVLCV